MNFFICSGSHRPHSQSNKVGRYIEARLPQLIQNANCDFFSLENNPLPLWDAGVWEKSEVWKEKWDPVAQRISKADALVIIAPEWGGMAPPGLKNFLLLAAGGTAPMAHKAGLLISISASRNGAYPIAELRMTSSKNNQLCYIPEHIIVRDVESCFNEEVSGSDDTYIRGRMDYALKVLNSYAEALNNVRKSGVLDPENYPFGM